MVSFSSLWLPIVLSAVLVFVASSLIHMVFTYHRSDYGKVSKEDDVMEALRKFAIPPGDYMLPNGGGPAAMKDPRFIEKMKQGPIVLMTVMKSGPPAMGPQLAAWFIYCLIVSCFAACLTAAVLPAGEISLEVAEFAGAITFIGYGLALWQNTIWYKRKWTTTLKSTIDSVIYAALTGGVFGWLWP